MYVPAPQNRNKTILALYPLNRMVVSQDFTTVIESKSSFTFCCRGSRLYFPRAAPHNVRTLMLSI